jgi:endogenous inhibitor of DNA gyrase (YacG/DUF329 family)
MTLALARVAYHMNGMSERVDIPPRVQRCPICSKPTVEQYRPFCSKRCADVDLNRWLSGVYVVPVEAAEDEDGRAEDEQAPKDQQVR